jgi:2'-5' RNA ligase
MRDWLVSTACSLAERDGGTRCAATPPRCARDSPAVRLFVAVWPPDEVRAAVERLPRPEHPAVRWTTPDQWHVTLRFLGEVADDDVPAVTAGLRAVGEQHTAREVQLGPRSTRLGKGPLVVPVAGLDDLAAAVLDATADVGAPPGRRPFTGHLTLARGRGRRPIPAVLAGAELAARWLVTEVVLVRSRPGAEGARYDVIATAPLQR